MAGIIFLQGTVVGACGRDNVSLAYDFDGVAASKET